MTDILEEMAEQSVDELWEAVRRGSGLTAAPPSAQKTVGGEGETAPLPLTAVLGELSRQSAALTRLVREESGRELRRSAAPVGAVGEGSRGNFALRSAVEGEDSMAGAERLDRLFRRDGRRYDGGFFLY